MGQHNENVTPQDCLGLTMALMKYPQPDLGDPEAVAKTIEDFFKICSENNSRPVIAALCSMLGTTRSEMIQTLKGVNTLFAQQLAPESFLEIEKAFGFIETNWEQSFINNGFSAPVTGIFYAKNNFGYKDTTENISVKVDTSKLLKASDVAAKYANAVPIEPLKVENLPAGE